MILTRKPAHLLGVTGLVALIMLGMWSAATRADDTPPIDAVLGYWLTTAHDGVIELYRCDDDKPQVCGRFHWLQDDGVGRISRDTENPDPAKRMRPMCGMQFMGGFRPDESGFYQGGWIYNPLNGKIYSARLSLVDNDTLNLHGYLLTPLLGETRQWKRTGSFPSCVTGQL